MVANYFILVWKPYRDTCRYYNKYIKCIFIFMFFTYLVTIPLKVTVGGSECGLPCGHSNDDNSLNIEGITYYEMATPFSIFSWLRVSLCAIRIFIGIRP